MKITAVGDFLIQQPYSAAYGGFDSLKAFIERGDARFFNLETTLNREGSCYCSQFSGGSYLRADPSVLETAKAYGFNMTTFNNNHSFDFGMDGFLSTLECIENSGLVHTGAGRSLPEAARPAYLDTPQGRAALISVSTSFEPSAMAGNPSKLYPARPGVNGLRVKRDLLVTEEQLGWIKQIAAESGINIVHDIDRKDGYLPELPDGVCELGSLLVSVSDRARVRAVIREEDLNRTYAAIDEAKTNADVVLLSLHNHDMMGEKEEVPQYVIDFCRSCADRGVNAVICHGPHLLRGIEIYGGCPIFYSLGDFVLQLNSIESAPADFYEKHGVKVDAGIKELLRVRSDDGKRGLMYDRKMTETVIPYFEIENGKLASLELLPVELGFDDTEEMRGIPRPAADYSFMERLQRISLPFGTEMQRDGEVFRVKLN